MIRPGISIIAVTLLAGAANAAPACDATDVVRSLTQSYADRPMPEGER
jgi:hypothetical protein